MYLPRGVLNRPFLGWGFLATSLLIRGLYVEPGQVKASYHRIRTHKKKTRMRIVHLTDLHLDSDKRRDHVPEMVNEQDPDLILMTGDYLNRSNAIRRLEGFIDRLESKYGIYASFGNWDGGKEEVLFRGTKVVPIRDTSLEVQIHEDGVRLVGIDSSSGHRAESLLRHLEGNVFTILLHHSPDLIEDIAPLGKIDLYLSGHTHGGQVRIPLLRGFRDGFRGKFPYAGSVAVFSKHGTKYESGMFRVGRTVLYVNRGLGMEGGLAPRIRLFCPPEVAVFDIAPYGV